jgi:fructose-1,6-bisphosphatase/inositol monophosphatase family enzyme
VSLKADRSPVTEADREAERAIVGVLRARCPEHGALGEEFGESGPRDRRFIVDPIDGTRNFVRRIPPWAVLIGLEEDGEVTAGVVYQPATGVLHTARRGQGAWRDGERIRVSPVDALDRALVVHSSVNSLRKSPYWEGFLHLADRTQVQRGFGAETKKNSENFETKKKIKVCLFHQFDQIMKKNKFQSTEKMSGNRTFHCLSIVRSALRSEQVKN